MPSLVTSYPFGIQNMTHLMPFSLRDTQRLFTYPAYLSNDKPSTLEMTNSSFARTIEPVDLPVDIRSSLVWNALALAPTKLQSRRLALTAILSGVCTNLGLSSLFTSGALRHMRYIRQPPSPGLHGLSLSTRDTVGSPFALGCPRQVSMLLCFCWNFW